MSEFFKTHLESLRGVEVCGGPLGSFIVCCPTLWEPVLAWGRWGDTRLPGQWDELLVCISSFSRLKTTFGNSIFERKKTLLMIISFLIGKITNFI